MPAGYINQEVRRIVVSTNSRFPENMFFILQTKVPRFFRHIRVSTKKLDRVIFDLTDFDEQLNVLILESMIVMNAASDWLDGFAADRFHNLTAYAGSSKPEIRRQATDDKADFTNIVEVFKIEKKMFNANIHLKLLETRVKVAKLMVLCFSASELTPEIISGMQELGFKFLD